MRCQDAIEKLRAIKGRLDEFDIERIGIFGSTARDQANPESDLDVLVEFGVTPSYFRLAELEAALKAEFGRPVDLFTPASIHPLLRDKILAEAVYA